MNGSNLIMMFKVFASNAGERLTDDEVRQLWDVLGPNLQKKIRQVANETIVVAKVVSK